MDYNQLINILSLGAGHQSSCLALRAARGEITPMPVAAIFADTQAEPVAVYRWLDWLERQLPFPVYRVKHHGLSLEESILRGTLRDASFAMPIPAYTVDRQTKKKGMVRRQCTRDYKIRPIERLAKEIMGHKKHSRLPTEPLVAQWIGISSDEIVRAKESREKWCVHRFPLCFEDPVFSRQDCVDWMKDHGYPLPPRSACYFCPYRSKDEWLDLKKDPNDWRRAVNLDRAIRKSGGMKGDVFLSSQCVPIEDLAESATPSASRQQFDLFADECDGMCGV